MGNGVAVRIMQAKSNLLGQARQAVRFAEAFPFGGSGALNSTVARDLAPLFAGAVSPRRSESGKMGVIPMIKGATP
jgi:hypothetical protein